MNRAAIPARTRAIAAVALVGVFAGYALSLAGGASAVSAADAPHKAFVCKYVGAPGKNERLQTGNNPISVAFSAIDGTRSSSARTSTMRTGARTSSPSTTVRTSRT